MIISKYKRRAAALIMALITALSLTACGSSGSDYEIDKESVVIAIEDEPETLDPTKGWGHGNSPIIQSTLVKYNSDLSFENDLAESYSLSDDGLVWTFEIRDDAYFTDGVKVTAEDVAFTLETAKNAQGSVDLTYMDSANAVSENTVEIRLKEPASIFLNTLASVGIVPKHAYSDDYGTSPIGSGPYKLKEWKPKEQIIFEANEDYYGEIPEIKNVTIVFMSEDAAFAAVKAGKVDAAYSAATLAGEDVDGYHIEALKACDNRGFTLPMSPDEGKKAESGAKIGNNVTCNIEIRKAIAYAIDRDLIAEKVLNGFAEPAYTENDGMPWSNSDAAIETDVDYAKKLLSDAGWKDTDGDGIVEKSGLKASFRCLYPAGDSVRQQVAMAASEQLKEIGIEMTVSGMSWDEISELMFSEAVLMGWGAASPNETYYLYRSGGAYKDDYYNPEGYMSSVTDSYIEKAMSAQSENEAYEYWKKVQWDGETGASMKGECPWVFIVNLNHVFYVRDGLSIGDQPIHGHGSGLPLVQNLNEWKWE